MKKVLPTKGAIRMILAEDVRAEAAGKFSLLGVFPAERFYVGGEVPAGVPEGVLFLMPSLIFVFIITAGEGKLTSRFRIVAPDKKTVILDTTIENGVEIIKGRPAVFVSGMKPFMGPAFGSYIAQLQLDKTKYQFPFLVEKAPPGFKPG